ncbi:hypothetical protein [Kitasatospora sp. NPDC127060]|uniref:hypothetical protein n=1 Tax=Kitasatospora sp. NPDC127060 TaxID=3347121 RepID=UPI00365F81D1
MAVMAALLTWWENRHIDRALEEARGHFVGAGPEGAQRCRSRFRHLVFRFWSVTGPTLPGGAHVPGGGSAVRPLVAPARPLPSGAGVGKDERLTVSR